MKPISAIIALLPSFALAAQPVNPAAANGTCQVGMDAQRQLLPAQRPLSAAAIEPIHSNLVGSYRDAVSPSSGSVRRVL
jgi:hypothetical protein